MFFHVKKYIILISCILDFTIESSIQVDNLFKDGFDFVGGILSEQLDNLFQDVLILSEVCYLKLS